MHVRIELTGTKAVRAAFASLVPKVQQQATAQFAQQVFNDVRSGAARHNKTGRLVNSVRMQKLPDGFRVFHDAVHAPHAKFVLYGTRPHLIFPKNRQALRWFGKGGNPIFAKFVKHPGTRPDDYVRRAYEGAGRHFAAIIHKINQMRFQNA